MGRGKHCTPEERKHIQGLFRENVPIKTICKAFDRSRTFVNNAIRSEATGKSTGRPRKTTANIDAQIVKKSRADPSKTCTRIKQELGLQVSSKTVSRRLHDAGFGAGRVQKRKEGSEAAAAPRRSAHSVCRRTSAASGTSSSEPACTLSRCAMGTLPGKRIPVST
uniref:Transposase Tc1-like domain-containing protein n=1 Tax=Anopheles gambiae TaxID=7165 RepID=A0A0E4G9D9_ANOGA